MLSAIALAAVAHDVVLHAALEVVVVAVSVDGLVEVAVDLVQIAGVVEVLDPGFGEVRDVLDFLRVAELLLFVFVAACI